MIHSIIALALPSNTILELVLALILELPDEMGKMNASSPSDVELNSGTGLPLDLQTSRTLVIP